MLWMTWWAWIAGALILAILETVLPIFAFGGMTVGAAVIGLILALGFDFGGSLGMMLVLFGALSLVATIGIRLWFGPRRGETRIIRNDIND